MSSSERRKTRICKPSQPYQAVPAPPALSMEEHELLVLSGKDAGKAFPLGGSCVRVGSGPANDVRLTDDTVSSSHVSIEQTKDGYLLKDLGSTNGTRVNGVPVVEAFLLRGADLTLGDTRLRFQQRQKH